ncbi:uncharacterized protein METZ01_LOCUS368327 [marine metagenome]|uniref:Uncharacterized protein n=1 Tax=marine metagenome TaxID=408172 RepID=A0A382T0H2_9ZZZZ
MYIAFRIKIKRRRKVFIVAAEIPKKLHITSSQLITAFSIICSFRFSAELLVLSPPEQLVGPGSIFCSIPTCQIE